MDTAFEVEAKLQHLVHQPRRLADAVIRRDDRVDPDARKDHEDGNDGDDFPTNVRHVHSARLTYSARAKAFALHAMPGVVALLARPFAGPFLHRLLAPVSAGGR